MLTSVLNTPASSTVFSAALEFIYTGQVSLPNRKLEQFVQLSKDLGLQGFSTDEEDGNGIDNKEEEVDQDESFENNVKLEDDFRNESSDPNDEDLDDEPYELPVKKEENRGTEKKKSPIKKLKNTSSPKKSLSPEESDWKKQQDAARLEKRKSIWFHEPESHLKDWKWEIITDVDSGSVTSKRATSQVRCGSRTCVCRPATLLTRCST